MRRKISLCLLCSISMVWSIGCIRVATINISQKTSLERQLMGDLAPLSEDEILASSIRAASNSPEKRHVPVSLQEIALQARRRQLFNRDDVDELTQAGCITLDLHGMLAARSCPKDQSTTVRQRINTMVHQENADRRAIIDWVIDADPALTEADRPRIEALYATLQQQDAANLNENVRAKASAHE